MRCTSCNKFVPYDTEVEPDVCLDVTLTCECGQTMKFDLEESCSASSMDELV
jgi:hypothetical protein